MNERIRELAEQAGFYFYDMHDIDGQDLGESIEADKWSVAEKFAELIAYECIDLALGSSHREDDMGAIIANKIKQYFGVEE
jgi:hypothetical protein